MTLPILLPLTAILDLILWAVIFVVALRGLQSSVADSCGQTVLGV